MLFTKLLVTKQDDGLKAMCRYNDGRLTIIDIDAKGSCCFRSSTVRPLLKFIESIPDCGCKPNEFTTDTPKAV